jgi:hypothetical protein
MNLSFNRKVMLDVRIYIYIYIYIYILYPPLVLLLNITLGLYIVTTILNETNVVCKILCWSNFILKHL